MVRTGLDDAEWASLLPAIQGLPRAWKRDEGALRRFVEAALWICRTGAPWRDLPAALGHRASVYHRRRRWCVRGWWESLFEARRPAPPAEGLVLLDSTTREAHRAASGAAQGPPAVEALGRGRGGLCSKLHGCVDGAGRIPRLLAGPANHADLRHAMPLVAGIPARDAALDRGYVSAALRAAFAAQGCTVHTPPKRGMHGRAAALGRGDLCPPASDREPLLQPQGLGAHRSPPRQDPPQSDGLRPSRRFHPQPTRREVRSQTLEQTADQLGRP